MTIADVYRQTVIAALDIAAENAARGAHGNAASLRKRAVVNVALLADARGWTYSGMRDRLAVLDASAEVRA